MDIRPRGETPVTPYRQIADYLRNQIKTGKLRPGDRLPSEDYLAQESGTAVSTVRRALKLLRDEGWIETVHAQGSFVKRQPDAEA
jgi:GntR family transcriptional regulator